MNSGFTGVPSSPSFLQTEEAMAMDEDMLENAECMTAFATYEDELDDVRKAPAPTPQDPLHAIVSTQSFNGSFSLTDAFSTAIGSSLTALENGNL